jgi:hypothetical protein
VQLRLPGEDGMGSMALGDELHDLLGSVNGTLEELKLPDPLKS